MIARDHLRRFVSDERGSAGEFALMLPIIILFLIGIIDAGRYAYGFSRGEKATQMGARTAVVTYPLVKELATYSFVGSTLSQGDRIPESALGRITCTSSACSCTTSPCLSGTLSHDPDAYKVVANRIKLIWPEVQDADIRVEYSGSGLGYAGNPSGMDIAPFVTVRLVNRRFTSFILLGGSVGFPNFRYTLTMEDGAGTQSN